MTEPKQLARLAGLLYAILAAGGGFAHIYVRGIIYEFGDASATADNLAGNADLARFGVLADVIGVLAYLFLAVTFYLLLQHLSRVAAGIMVILVAIATAMTTLNLVFQYVGIRVATEPAYTNAFLTGESDALALLLFDLQYYGYLLVQAFTGPWLVPLGYLLYKSGWFPRPLGVLLIVGCGCYLVDLGLQLMVPDLARRISDFVLAPAIVGEMWLIGYLFVRGSKFEPLIDQAPGIGMDVGASHL